MDNPCLAKWLRYAVRIGEMERDPYCPYENISDVAWEEAVHQTWDPLRGDWARWEKQLKAWCRGEGSPPTRPQLVSICDGLKVPWWLRVELFKAAGYEMGISLMVVPTAASTLSAAEQRADVDQSLAWLEQHNPHGYALLCKQLDRRVNDSPFEKRIRRERAGRR